MSIPRELPPGRAPGPQFWIALAPHRLHVLTVALRFIWGMEHVR